MFSRFRHLVRDRRPYSIFTTDFDQEVRASDLLALIESEAGAPIPDAADPLLEPLRASLKRGFSGLDLDLEPDDRLTVLIDHSGSMRGAPIAVAAVIADELSRWLDANGVRYEVLGYTTRNWRGGRSRTRWIEEDGPRHPGRLCDLRHIIYRQVDDQDDWRPSLRLMSADILREGVDGEAVEWAMARMGAPAAAGRRIVIHIGDGSPVDDSTQQANGPWVLEDHYLDVVGRLRAEGVRYVLLSFRLWDVDIPQFLLEPQPDACATAVVAGVRDLFLRSPTSA